MTTDRFDEMLADSTEKATPACPKCASRKFTENTEIDSGMCKIGVRWIKCLDCGYLFIRNEEEE